MWVDILAYLTTGGTAPWIVGPIAVGVVALIIRTKASEPGRHGMLLALAVVAFVFAALAMLALAASRGCAGAGGCTH